MKVLLHSNAPWAQTGYGNQTSLLSLLLKDAGHDVAISAFWGLGGQKMEWNGMPVFPAGPDFGDTWLPPYAAHWGDGDPSSVQVLTLMDVWTLKSPLLAHLNVAAWCPVDHDPLSPIVHEFFKRTNALPIAMSRFGERAFAEAGLEALYAPHAVDTDVFGPFPQHEIREANGLPKDAFIVGMVANNKGNAPPRKAFPQVFEAFAEFHKRHDDAFLYVHTAEPENVRDGINLTALADKTGVPLKRMTCTPPLAIQMGLSGTHMAGLYSSLDVLACPSYGEGFGIPIIEAQACGVPVIVNNWTAMPELVGHGWVTEGERWWDMSQGSYFKHATVSSILDCLEEAYLERGGGSEKAREFAVQYDVRTVFETFWLPILEQLEGRLGEQSRMPKVTLNRKGRRKSRAKKAA